MSDTIIVDTPEGIEAYRLIATLHGLEMEVTFPEKYGVPPQATPTRGLALGSARRILDAYNVPGGRRTRKQCLAAMRQLCQQLGLTEGEH